MPSLPASMRSVQEEDMKTNIGNKMPRKNLLLISFVFYFVNEIDKPCEKSCLE